MTISSTDEPRAGPFEGDGSQDEFPFEFKVFAKADVQVLHTDEDGVDTVLVLDSDYSVELNADQNNNPGGTVTYPISGSALPAGETLTIVSNLEFTQTTDVQNAGGFYPEVIENALDRLTMLIKQVHTKVVRTLQMSVATPDNVDASLPVPAASNLLGWNSTATGLRNYAVSDGISIVGVDPTDLANDADGADGAGMVGFGATLTYPENTVGHALMQRCVSVTDSPFNAVGDGTTDDTDALTAAQAAASFVYVPEGLVCKVDAGLNYWQFFGPGRVIEAGQEWELNPFPLAQQLLRSYRSRTFGNYENAAGASVSINSDADLETTNTQIAGATTDGIALLGALDHVALYAQAYSFEPDATSAATTYTATTLTDANVGTYNATPGRIKRGMYVKTKHATPCVGRVQSVAGNVITVDGWYEWGTGASVTPGNGTGALINPNVKIWGQNTNIFVRGTAANNQAQKGTGYELGISCDASMPGTNVWGFDVITLAGTPEAHFIARGDRSIAFYSHDSGGVTGFASDGDEIGFDARDPVSTAYRVQVAGATKWNVGAAGAVVGDFRAVRAISAGGNIVDTDNLLLVNTTSTVTLPTPVGRANRVFTVKALVNATIGTAASTIDGGATKSITANASLHFVSDGNFWYSF